ncbi:MAG: SUMF1/EgtB/PvdO family nonheme iron enzyme [Fimbriimonadaceae bacterium]|nr:SUMF1/EgtB/PvdO family nonheme iron enzyme [Fimbriimonadaceae bacterium]
MIPSIVLAASILTPQTHEPLVEKLPDHLVEWKMIHVPGGKINIRGTEVEVKPFYIMETEVTWNLYDIYYLRLDMTDDQRAANHDASLRPSRPYGAVDRGFGHNGYPAIGMAGHAAGVFAEWLTGKMSHPYRIPTEAEWEFAARANVEVPVALAEYAVFWDNSDDKTAPVKGKKPNAWGIYDTLGNASEWAVGLDGVLTTCGGNFLTEGSKLSPSFREPYTVKWQERDPQQPKSKWWLSDGPQVGLRLVFSAE